MVQPLNPDHVRKIKRRFPNAVQIRFSGKCPNCKQRYEYSLQFPEDLDRDPKPNIFGEMEETCGYMCVSCGWSNAGSRLVEET